MLNSSSELPSILLPIHIEFSLRVSVSIVCHHSPLGRAIYHCPRSTRDSLGRVALLSGHDSSIPPTPCLRLVAVQTPRFFFRSTTRHAGAGTATCGASPSYREKLLPRSQCIMPSHRGEQGHERLRCLDGAGLGRQRPWVKFMK